MVERDPERATHELAEVGRRLRRGAELTQPPPRWWYPGLCLLFTLWGATWDTPLSWRWLPTVALAPTVLAVLLLLPRRRARPLPVRFGWRVWLLVGAGAFALIVAALGLGVGLRVLGVPLPFTLSGLCLGVAVCVVSRYARRWRAGYVEQVVRGRW